MEDWAEIRRLHRAEGMPIKVIARVLGVSRNTVRAAIASTGPPRMSASRRGDRGRGRAADPGAAEGFSDDAGDGDRGADRLGPVDPGAVGRVAQLRLAYLPPDPAGRTSYVAGEIAQCDLWFPPITLAVGSGQARTAKHFPVLTMVTGYSRWLAGMLIPSRRSEDLFAGWWQLIEQLGAVPRALVWDGEGAIGGGRASRS